MPRKTKEQKELENLNMPSNTVQKDAKMSSNISNKKVNSKTKNEINKSSNRSNKTTKTSTSTSKKSTKSSNSTNKKVKSKTVSKTNILTSTKKVETKGSVVEYYDLPYRYNQTIVKVLAQTPNNLFVYWDIADSDRENFKKQYGYDFFDKTRPVLIVHNETMHYAFEVEINDFANSWYLHVNDANCDYKIELGRKPFYNYIQRKIGEEEQKDPNSEVNKYPSKSIDKDYFYVTMSNAIDSPNNHILAEDYNKPINSVLVRNVKSNVEYNKNIESFNLDNLRWDKVIICTDADVDGFQIRTLVLTMIYRLMPTLIEKGKVYIAESPLYEITITKTKRKGEKHFAYTDGEKEEILKKFTEDGLSKERDEYDIKRSKGLGENEPDMMSLTTMHPSTRRLIRVTPENAESTSRMFDVLLGDNITDRKEYIADNGGKYMEMLDLS